MFGQFLTSEARLVIEELRGNTRDKGAYMKLSVLILLDMGKSYDEIELILGIGRGSITNCRHKYEADGQDKLIPSNTGRRRVNINGAMNAHHPEEVVIHEADTINAEATIALYDKIQQKYPDKEHIYVIGDNARHYYNAQWQAWLAQNPRITQVFLPTYSPNLNLIKRLWKFLRKKIINTHFYPDFKDFRQAILHFFEHIQQYKAELDSLITFKFQRLGKPDTAYTTFNTTSC